MNKYVWAVVATFTACSVSLAQDSFEEVVVTGSMIREKIRIPATSLKRQADFLILNVEVNNDSRDYKNRREEIYTTLRAFQAAAEKDKSIELSIIRDESIVLPLQLDDTALNFKDSGTNGTLETTISVKTRITPRASGAALIAKLKNFVSSIKPAGRTDLSDDDETQVSVVSIAQYRDPVIQLFANDVKKITTALGGDYRVITRGLDQPIQWVRSGTLEVTIFVAYTYDVVPTTISSYLVPDIRSDD